MYGSKYRFVAFALWLTPVNATVQDRRHVYQCLDPKIESHTHLEPIQSRHTLAVIGNCELSVEILETCCFAVKRTKYDLKERSWESITNEFLLINNKTGEIECKRYLDMSLFSIPS